MQMLSKTPIFSELLWIVWLKITHGQSIPLKNWFGSKPPKVDAEVVLVPNAAAPLALIPAPETKICVLIGPEGGFSETEYGDAEVSGFQAVSLGPRVLRTESAAIATLSVLQSMWGDLR